MTSAASINIALNCVALDHRRPIGVERFTRNVLGAADLGDGDIQCYVRRAVPELSDVLGPDFVVRHKKLSQRRIPVNGSIPRILLEMLALPFLTRGADVVLSINNFGPLWGKRGQRRLVVVHDVWFMSEGYEGGRLAKWLFRFLLRLQLNRTPIIVTVSEFSRREICRHFDVDPARVIVVGNCLGNRVEPVPANNGRQKLLLLVGSARRNKNVIRAIEGFQHYHRSNPDHDSRMVIVGNYPEQWVADTRRRFGAVESLLDWRGYVDDTELNRLYESAHGLVFVSLYEGFGIPAMEAILRGRPVLVAENTATADILGDLGITDLLRSRVDTDSDAFRAFRDRYMSCEGAAGRLSSVVTAG